MDGLFTNPWEDNPRISTVEIAAESYNWDSDETIIFEYDRSLLFPLTQWLQEHRGEKVTHEMYTEFNRLSSDVKADFICEYTPDDGRNENATEASDVLCFTISGMMLALWDMRAELRPWMVERACRFLVGRHVKTDRLPEANSDTYSRERDYRGGPNGMEKALANLDAAILTKGRAEKPYPEVGNNDE